MQGKIAGLTLTLILAAAISAIAAPIEPAAVSEQAPRTIVVSGAGEATAAPDDAIMDFAIETHAKTAAEAARLNAELATKVVKTLKSHLAGRGQISTGGYSLSPDYRQHPGDQSETIVGYTARNSISVETGALDLPGTLIDSAIAAGANRVNYLNFTLKDNTRTRAKAIAAAAHDAQAQAQSLAAAIGVKLGRVLKASTQEEIHPIPVMRAMSVGMAQGAVTTPVEAGQVTVPANVALTYEIE